MNIQQVLVFAIAIIIALWLGSKWLLKRGKTGREAAKYMQYIVMVVALLVAVGYTFWSKPRPMKLWDARPELVVLEWGSQQVELTEESLEKLESLAESTKVSPIGVVKSFPDASWYLYGGEEQDLLWGINEQRALSGKILYKGNFKDLCQYVEGLVDE